MEVSGYDKLFLRISGIILVVVGLVFLRNTWSLGLLAYSPFSLAISLALIFTPILGSFWLFFEARDRPPRHYIEHKPRGALKNR